MSVPGLLKLRDVLLIDGLKANLIRISQLCDQNLFVNFIKDKCIIIYRISNTSWKGNRLSDNYYILASLNTCLNMVHNDTSLWHRWMGHVNHNNLKETIDVEAIKGVPNLK